MVVPQIINERIKEDPKEGALGGKRNKIRKQNLTTHTDPAAVTFSSLVKGTLHPHAREANADISKFTAARCVDGPGGDSV